MYQVSTPGPKHTFILSRVDMYSQERTTLTGWDETVRKERSFLKSLGRQVRALRQHRGFTQAKLAERAGIGMKYVGEIERGTTNPTTSLLWRLSEALEVETCELFLLSGTDGDRASQLQVRLVQLLKDRSEKDLERIEQILSLIDH